MSFHMEGVNSVMTITPQVKATLAESLTPLRAGRGHVSITWARKAVGQAQRLAQVVPDAQPWASALWAALTGATQAAESGQREAPPGRLPACRFATGARWMMALLEGSILPLSRTVTPDANPHRVAGPRGMAFRRKPLGLGAVLTDNGIFVAWARGMWDAPTVKRFNAVIGDPAWQTTWEFLACLITLEMWGVPDTPFTVFGDNTGALQNLAKLKGRGLDVNIAKEIAWRQAARHWLPIPVHKPGELNVHSDALSRVDVPPWADRKPFPKELLGVTRTPAPDIEGLWKAWAPTAAANPKRRRKGRGPAPTT